jgi:hypothetical protein
MNADNFFVVGGVLFWVFLVFFSLIPLFVWMQLRQIIKLLREIRDSNDRIADNTTPAIQKTSASSSVKYSMPQ